MGVGIRKEAAACRSHNTYESPPPPHYRQAIQIADRLAKETRDAFQDVPDQLTEVITEIHAIKVAALAGQRGFGTLSEFEDQNCAIAFPESFYLNDLRGTKYYTTSGPSEFFSLEVRPVGNSASRQKTYDALCETRLTRGPGKPILGVVYEYSPIRWKGHYGYDSCYMIQRDGFLWLYDHRDIFVGDTLYCLCHQTCLVVPMDDVHRMRRPTRETARLFYQSFRLLNPPTVEAKPEQQSLQGRWVVESGPSARRANHSPRPKELAFLGTALYGGPSGCWGYERGNGPLPQGIFHMARFVVDPSPGTIELDVVGPRKVEMTFHYRIDNDRLLMSSEPFEVHADGDLPEHVDIFVRPGDGVPLL